LVKVVLYGSQARGEAEPGADIDVLVVLDGPVDASGDIVRTEFDVADISLAHNVVIACLFVSREQFEREHTPLMMNVRWEGCVLHRRGPPRLPMCIGRSLRGAQRVIAWL